MRDEMLAAVIRRAIEYPEFRDQLMERPEEALSEHGFALESREMDALQSIRQEMQSNAGTDAEQKLRSIAEEYGVNPRPDRTGA